MHAVDGGIYSVTTNFEDYHFKYDVFQSHVPFLCRTSALKVFLQHSQIYISIFRDFGKITLNFFNSFWFKYLTIFLLYGQRFEHQKSVTRNISVAKFLCMCFLILLIFSNLSCQLDFPFRLASNPWSITP